jgi:putative ABC transport system permease protein
VWWKFWRQRSRDRDLADEIAFDLAAEAEERRAAGLSPEQAARASRRDFGNVLRVQERTRETWGWGPVERLARDARYALRQLARSPGFTAVAVLSLALGIGVNTAIFTLINVTMLKSLPVSRPEELLHVTTTTPAVGKGSGLTREHWQSFRERQDVFDSAFAYGSTGNADLANGGEPRPVNVGLVTGEFFPTLGVHALAGRLLNDSDDRPGCSGVAVLTYDFWQREHGGRPDIVGRTFSLSGQPFQIAGVVEPPFFGIEYGYHTPIWIPHCATTLLRPGTTWQAGVMVGRVKPGVTIEQARARLATIPAPFGRGSYTAVPFAKGQGYLRASYGDALWTLMAIVAVVLLITCVNLANLLLARAAARQREIAVRLALGAGRGALLRQLLVESLMLSVAGAGLGIFVAHQGSAALVRMLIRPGQVVLDLSPDWRVLSFSIAAGVLTGILFGFAPAWRAVRVDLHIAMKPAGRASLGRLASAKALVASQVALSLVLVVAAGLLVSTWRRTAALDPGFRPGGVLIAEVTARFSSAPAPLFDRVLDRLRAVPGVAAAAPSSRTPFSNLSSGVEIDRLPGAAEAKTVVSFMEVGSEYFAALGAPLLAGRAFNSGDSPHSPPVVIVGEEFARRYVPGASALGARFSARWRSVTGPPFEIVGIVGNTKEASLREPDRPVVYFALAQNPQPGALRAFTIRSNRPTAALAADVKAVLAEIDPRLSVTLRSLQSRIDETLRLPRTLALLSAFFGILALLLAAVGLYGVVQYSVQRRRSEIGVRLALGAGRGRVLRLVLRDVGLIVLAGIALGAPLSLAANRLVSRFLFGVQPNDPAILAAAAVALALVAAAAAAAPARRAAKLDPMAVLRDD